MPCCWRDHNACSKRVQDEVGGHPGGGAPAHDPAAEHVDHERDVGHALALSRVSARGGEAPSGPSLPESHAKLGEVITPTVSSLGTLTDLQLLILEGSVIEERADYFVIRSPLRPSFHWGNYVYVPDSQDCDDVDRWVAAFQLEFPEADWVAIGLSQHPRGDRWERAGFDVSADEVLTSASLPASSPLRPGYTQRCISSDEDWQQLANETAESLALTFEGSPDDFATFNQEQQATRRRLVADGHMAFFAAFDEMDQLAASLGIVCLGGGARIARYQSVFTSPAHRRRGLAAHLLGVAARWAFERGARELVIVTDHDNPAGLLYRRLGFRPGASDVTAYRAHVGQ